MSSMMDSLTSRFSASTLSSSAKSRVTTRSGASEPIRKTSSKLIPSRLVSLKSRIGMGPMPKMTPAEKINHDSAEGRKEFYDQVFSRPRRDPNLPLIGGVNSISQKTGRSPFPLYIFFLPK